MEINIISPTRGCKYTLAEVLEKGLLRSSLKSNGWELKHLHRCFYGSHDVSLDIIDFRTSESQWADSINFKIDGIIPLHVTEGGKIEAGFHCGCDKSYNGNFPGDLIPPENPGWDSYKQIRLANITYWLGEQKGTINLGDIPSNDKAWDVISELVINLLARAVIKIACLEDPAFKLADAK
jgi:hypothetical protein